MKRIAVLILLVCAAAGAATARQSAGSDEVTEKQWQEVLSAVSGEEWDTAFALSSKYMNLLKEEDERLPRLRYIYLYAAAGRVSVGGMDYDALGQAIKGLEGKSISLPYRTILARCQGELNFICGSQGPEDRLMVAATNKTGTTILAFEYVQLKEKFDAAAHEGEEASINGRIDAIKPNPNRSNILILRLYVNGGTIKLKGKTQDRAALR
jgi:hypothetical protein